MGSKFNKVKEFIIVFAAIITVADFLWTVSNKMSIGVFGNKSGGIVVDFLYDRWVSIIGIILIGIVGTQFYLGKKREKEQQKQKKIEDHKQQKIETNLIIHDFPSKIIPNISLRSAILFLIDNPSNIGENLTWFEILDKIRRAIIDEKIHIWAKYDENKTHFALTKEQLKGSAILIDDNLNDKGSIRLKDYKTLGDIMLSKKEIEKIFTKL